MRISFKVLILKLRQEEGEAIAWSYSRVHHRRDRVQEPSLPSLSLSSLQQQQQSLSENKNDVNYLFMLGRFVNSSNSSKLLLPLLHAIAQEGQYTSCLATAAADGTPGSFAPRAPSTEYINYFACRILITHRLNNTRNTANATTPAHSSPSVDYRIVSYRISLVHRFILLKNSFTTAIRWMMHCWMLSLWSTRTSAVWLVGLGRTMSTTWKECHLWLKSFAWTLSYFIYFLFFFWFLIGSMVNRITRHPQPVELVEVYNLILI